VAAARKSISLIELLRLCYRSVGVDVSVNFQVNNNDLVERERNTFAMLK